MRNNQSKLDVLRVIQKLSYLDKINGKDNLILVSISLYGFYFAIYVHLAS